MIPDSVFRLYDIRGRVPEEICIDEIAALTRAIVQYYLTQEPSLKTIVVGRDGRTHSPLIHSIVVETLCQNGLNVLDIGICPTPVLYFTLATHPGTDAGIMITASHNGKEYNGMKLCLKGRSVWGKEIQNIKTLYREKSEIINTEQHQGSVSFFDACSSYIAWMIEQFPHLRNKTINCSIDCANGAAGAIIPRLVRAFEWKDVDILFSEIDGTYPHHEADPTQPENMQHLLSHIRENNKSFGIGLDGDADRMVPLLFDGTLVPGDQLLAVFACAIAADYQNRAVVFDIKCSSGLPEILSLHGIIPHMSPSGHSIIKQEMATTHAVLGGELSCHFFFADRSFGYDDGIYAAVRLLELLVVQNTSLETLLAPFPKRWNTPEFRLACTPDSQQKIMLSVKTWAEQFSDAEIVTVDGIRVNRPNGWVLVRGSNTQPVICVRYEANSATELHNLQNAIEPLIKPFLISNSYTSM